MESATPLFLLLLALVLVVATAQGTAAEAAKGFPSASGVITYVIAAIIAAIGGGTMLWRRFGKAGAAAAGGADVEDVRTWAKVLSNAVGPAVAAAAGGLLKHWAWGLLVIATIIGTVFTLGIANPTSPLAWIAYVAIGIISLVALFTSPVVSAYRSEGGVGRLLSWLSKTFTSPVAIGAVIFAAVAIGVLALGTLYPLIGWGVLGTLVAVGLYYWHRSVFDTKPGAGIDADAKVEADAERAGDAEAHKWWAGIKDGLADAVAWLTLSPERLAKYRKRTGESTHTATGDESAEDREALTIAASEARKGVMSEYGLALATLATSGGIIGLAVALPFLWRRLPSLRLMGRMGTELLGDAVPLSTYAAMEVPGSSTAWRAPTVGRKLPRGAISGAAGTANYTIAWWQFINARTHTEAIPALDLGPAGQMLLGPGSTTATLALNSPAPLDAVYKVPIAVKLQRWQHVVVRASGDRSDVFVDGRLVGSSLHPPAALRIGDVLTLPGTAPQKTEGGIAKLTYSGKAEPYSAIVLAAYSPPAEIQ